MRLVALAGILLVVGGCGSREGPVATQLADRIVVDAAEKSAYALGKHPFHDKNFEKRISELKGRRIEDIVDFDLIRKIVKPKSFVSKTDLKVVELSNELILSALRSGRIIHQEHMVYHLDRSRECTLEMQEGTVVMGVYYKPVGYIRLNNDESYWFLFGAGKDAGQ